MAVEVAVGSEMVVLSFLKPITVWGSGSYMAGEKAGFDPATAAAIVEAGAAVEVSRSIKQAVPRPEDESPTQPAGARRVAPSKAV